MDNFKIMFEGIVQITRLKTVLHRFNLTFCQLSFIVFLSEFIQNLYFYVSSEFVYY